MPPVEQSIAQGQPIRMMLVGDFMLRKTSFALGAAEAGFNVIYIDADGNPQPLKYMSKPAQQRTFHVEVMDQGDNFAAQWGFYWFLSGKEFLWNEKRRQVNTASALGVDPNTPAFKFNPKLLTKDDVIIFDSHTAYCKSLMFRYFQENDIELIDAVDRTADWADFSWTGKLADWFLGKLKTLPCNVILICHSEYHEKKDKKGIVLSSKTRAVSTSRTNADTMGKYFTDILYFDLVDKTIFVDCQVGEGVIAGSRTIKPFRERLTEISFKKFADAAGLKPSGSPMSALTFGTWAELTGKVKPSATVISPETQPITDAGPGAPVINIALEPPKAKISLGTFMKAK